MNKWGCPKCEVELPNPNSILDKIMGYLKSENLRPKDIGLDFVCIPCGHEFDEPTEWKDE